jgi:hypothetical protein
VPWTGFVVAVMTVVAAVFDVATLSLLILMLVEDERQMASLTVMRCDLAQGFYFSKPLGGEAAGSS